MKTIKRKRCLEGEKKERMQRILTKKNDKIPAPKETADKYCRHLLPELFLRLYKCG